MISYAYMVSCPTCTKNLEWYLVQVQSNSTVYLFIKKNIFSIFCYFRCLSKKTKTKMLLLEKQKQNIYSSFRNKKREKFATLLGIYVNLKHVICLYRNNPTVLLDIVLYRAVFVIRNDSIISS